MMEFQSIVPAKWNHFGHLLKDRCTLTWSILSLAGLEGVEEDDQPDSHGIGTPLPWVLQVMLKNLFGVKD